MTGHVIEQKLRNSTRVRFIKSAVKEKIKKTKWRLVSLRMNTISGQFLIKQTIRRITVSLIAITVLNLNEKCPSNPTVMLKNAWIWSLRNCQKYILTNSIEIWHDYCWLVYKTISFRQIVKCRELIWSPMMSIRCYNG